MRNWCYTIIIEDVCSRTIIFPVFKISTNLFPFRLAFHQLGAPDPIAKSSSTSCFTYMAQRNGWQHSGPAHGGGHY
jgi:hypothetical protein